MEQISLEKGLSYSRLADEISAVTGRKISSATVMRVAKGATPGRLTQSIIDDYLAKVATAA